MTIGIYEAVQVSSILPLKTNVNLDLPVEIVKPKETVEGISR